MSESKAYLSCILRLGQTRHSVSQLTHPLANGRVQVDLDALHLPLDRQDPRGPPRDRLRRLARRAIPLQRARADLVAARRDGPGVEDGLCNN